MLVPYPNYGMNRLPNRRERAVDHIINTFRISVDACDRLWVIDMGAANGTTYGQPQLFVIDLNTDRVVRQFTIAGNLRRRDDSTWFPGLIADVDPRYCDRAFAYLPDIGCGLVVYSFRTNSAWRLEHPFFYFDPLATSFNISGIRLQWNDGVFGLALSERHSDGYRTLYFSAMSSTRMFSVNTRILQSNRSVADTIDDYRHLGHRLPGMQAASMSMDGATGALFYALVNQDAIGCWNPRRSGQHSTETMAIVAKDSVTLQFPADLKVDVNSNLWVLSDRMPLYRFRVHDLDVTDVNYRVFRAPVADVIRGTVCEPTESSATLSSGSNVGYNSNSEYNMNSEYNTGSNMGSNTGSNVEFDRERDTSSSDGFNTNPLRTTTRPRPSQQSNSNIAWSTSRLD